MYLNVGEEVEEVTQTRSLLITFDVFKCFKDTV